MNESPIFARTHDLLLWLLPQATKFPRVHRFGLGERLVRQALDFQETLITAGLDKGQGRKEGLQQADVQLALLRHWVRLCKDLELLTVAQYAHVSGMVIEIGRLLGSWKKKLNGAG